MWQIDHLRRKNTYQFTPDVYDEYAIGCQSDEESSFYNVKVCNENNKEQYGYPSLSLNDNDEYYKFEAGQTYIIYVADDYLNGAGGYTLSVVLDSDDDEQEDDDE